MQHELLKSVEMTHPPSQMVVGSDAKYSMLILRHMPVWLQDWILSIAIRSSVKPKIITNL